METKTKIIIGVTALLAIGFGAYVISERRKRIMLPNPILKEPKQTEVKKEEKIELPSLHPKKEIPLGKAKEILGYYNKKKDEMAVSKINPEDSKAANLILTALMREINDGGWKLNPTDNGIVSQPLVKINQTSR